jgi:hypothetical protein
MKANELVKTNTQHYRIIEMREKGIERACISGLTYKEVEEWASSNTTAHPIRNDLRIAIDPKAVNSKGYPFTYRLEKDTDAACEDIDNRIWGFFVLDMKIKDKDIYISTPGCFPKNRVREVIEVEEIDGDCILSFDQLNSVHFERVECPGFYTRDGKRHDDVVYYDLGSSLAPMLRRDAKGQATRDAAMLKVGGVPLGTGVIIEIGDV